MVDETYLMLIKQVLAGEHVTTRGHACVRQRHVVTDFTSTPLIGVRRTAWRQALQEFEWFMSGSTAVADLPKDTQSWWAPWGDGVGYGRFASNLRSGAFSIWDPTGPLPPCSYTALTPRIFNGNLHVTMMQRSCDLVCGLPHDWIQLWAYSLWMASQLNVRLERCRWICNDLHIYAEHLPVITEIMKQPITTSARMIYTPSSREFKASDFSLTDPYVPSLTMKAKLIV